VIHRTSDFYAVSAGTVAGVCKTDVATFCQSLMSYEPLQATLYARCLLLLEELLQV